MSFQMFPYSFSKNYELDRCSFVALIKSMELHTRQCYTQLFDVNMVKYTSMDISFQRRRHLDTTITLHCTVTPCRTYFLIEGLYFDIPEETYTVTIGNRPAHHVIWDVYVCVYFVCKRGEKIYRK